VRVTYVPYLRICSDTVNFIVPVLLIVTERVKPSDEGCPEDCGDECKPICAEHEDKKVQLTFCSHCVMEMYNCHNDDNYKMVKPTKC
ncbi:hypothetical protein C0J52_08207, partial [Blattella germanica]